MSADESYCQACCHIRQLLEELGEYRRGLDSCVSAEVAKELLVVRNSKLQLGGIGKLGGQR
jgi:hypothetical protein